MLDRCVVSSLVMFACVFILGCLASVPPTKLEPIESVPAAIVEVAYSASEEKIVPTIVMHSASFNCPPCESWIRNDMPTWQAAGWTIPEPLKEAEPGKSYPWFEIKDGDGLRFEVIGPLTKEKYEHARKKALGK